MQGTLAKLSRSFQKQVFIKRRRGEWTQEQDFELLERVVEDGKKWAKIGVLLHRTEHCIKNRFNSILAKQKKLTPNIRREEKLIE